jgi:hypothetical protein
MRHLLAAVFVLATCVSVADAADLVFTGTWMATQSRDKDADPADATVFTRYRPGEIVIVIAQGTVKTTTWRQQERTMGWPADTSNKTYTVDEVTADHAKLTANDTNFIKPHPKPLTITAHPPGIEITDDDLVTTCIPVDAAAIAKEDLRYTAAAAPADPLLDQPLAGRIAGVAWKPIRARRCDEPAGKPDDPITIEVTPDIPPKNENDQQPHLLFRMPVKPGTYPLDGNTNITVIHGNDQIPTMNGTLVVYSVTAAAIAFGLTIRGLDDTVINGRMTADVSPIVDGVTWPTPPAGK